MGTSRLKFLSALFFILIFFLNQNLNAQIIKLEPDSTNQTSIISFSNFQLQRMKFARLLRAKYALSDSLAKLWSPSSYSQLEFNITTPGFLDFENNIAFDPELFRSAWEGDFRKRAYGGEEPFIINPAQIISSFKKDKKWEKGKKEFRDNFIPSNLQLDVLTVLWREEKTSQLEIYAGIDAAYPITAEKLDYQLERMVKLGLLERKIISPQNKFMILTPLKVFLLEKSSLNRKNRVFLYRTRVEKDQIVKLLMTRFYRVRNENVGRSDEINRLSKKLKIVLPSEDG